MGPPPVKLYTDGAYIPAGHRHCMLLIPFWGDYHDHGGYARWAHEGRDRFRLTSPEEAELAVLPFDGSSLISPGPRCREALQLADRFLTKARGAGLRTIVIVNSDSNRHLPWPDAIVFRTSLNRRTRLANEFALPAWHEDLVRDHLHGRLVIRERRAAPTVGFCGHSARAGPKPRRRLKMLIRRLIRPLGLHIDHSDGSYLRRSALLALAGCENINHEFIIRDHYFGGGLEGPESMRCVRNDYVNNFVISDYALCTRGLGNFSFRFFEALSMGRIPLLIDTECVHPYDFLHDYRRFCVIVPEAEVARSGAALTEFHSRLSAAEFRDIQRRIRSFWVRWLSPEGFFGNLHLHWRREPGARPQRIGGHASDGALTLPGECRSKG